MSLIASFNASDVTRVIDAMKILIVSPRALNFALAESILMLLLFFFVLCAMPLSTGKTPSMSLGTTDSRVDDLKTEIVDLLTLFGAKTKQP